MPCNSCLDLLEKKIKENGRSTTKLPYNQMASGDHETISTRSGVREIRELEVFILSFQGSVMIVHMLVLFSWYPPAKQVPLFFGANSQQSEPNHSYRLLNTIMQWNQPTMPINH